MGADGMQRMGSFNTFLPFCQMLLWAFWLKWNSIESSNLLHKPNHYPILQTSPPQCGLFILTRSPHWGGEVCTGHFKTQKKYNECDVCYKTKHFQTLSKVDILILDGGGGVMENKKKSSKREILLQSADWRSKIDENAIYLGTS